MDGRPVDGGAVLAAGLESFDGMVLLGRGCGCCGRSGHFIEAACGCEQFAHRRGASLSQAEVLWCPAQRRQVSRPLQRES